MLSALLLGLSQPGITLEIPGRPLFEVLAKLETLTNEKLLPAAEIKHLPLILKVTNQPWSEVKKQIAWATWATWIERDGKWVLQRTKANHEEFSLRQVRRRMMMMEPFFDGIVKRAEKSGDWQKEASIGLDPLERKYAGRIKSDAWRLIASLGKERFAQNENEIWCYPARTNETPFPSQAEPILKDILVETNKPRQERGRPLVTQIVLTGGGGLYKLILADQSGHVVSSVQDYLSGEAQTPIKLPKSEIIPLSPLTQNWVEVRQITPKQPPVVTAELRDALLDPVKTDPTQLFAGPALLEIGKLLDANIVAVVCPTAVFRMIRQSDAITGDTFLNRLQITDEVVVSDSWLRVRPDYIFPAGAVDRATLKRVLITAWGAKTNDDRAEALFESQSWSEPSFIEFLAMAVVLFPGSEISGERPPLAHLFEDQRAPFRRMVRLTPDERLDVERVFRRGMDWVLPAGTTKLDEVTRAIGGTLGGGLESNLAFLPSRLYPNGIPVEIEIEFEPAAKIGPSRVRMSPDESMKDAKMVHPITYAAHLADIKAGKVMKELKWFAETGSAGGKIIYRIPKVAEVEINASIFATSPSASPKPIKDLPEEFQRKVRYHATGLANDQGPGYKPPPQKLKAYTN